MEGACSSLAKSPPSPVNTTIATSSITMTKLLCVVLASSLLLATLAGASSSSLASSLGRHQAQVLGRKGRELGQSGHHYQHQSKHVQQDEEVAMEVKTPAETKADWTVDQGDDAKEGLINSADYSSVAMHAGSPPTPKPKHRHPKP